jgi:hypothetical protein
VWDPASVCQVVDELIPQQPSCVVPRACAGCQSQVALRMQSYAANKCCFATQGKLPVAVQAVKVSTVTQGCVL